MCDIYLSLLICFGNYEMFLIMQLNLTCRSFRRTSNNSSEEELEAPWVRDTVTKERALEEDEEKGRATSINEYHIGHKISSKIKKSMTRIPKKVISLGHTPFI